MKRYSLITLFTAAFLSCFTGYGQTIRTIAGCGISDSVSGFNRPAVKATMGQIIGTAVDNNGNVYISDFYYNRIYKVTPNGTFKTVAGDGAGNCIGDGGLAVNAHVNSPTSITTDAAGNLFIADAGNRCIRKIDASTGRITTVGGMICTVSSCYYNGEGIQATNACMIPQGIAVDRSGNIYYADGNSRVRKISTDGIVRTICGSPTGAIGFAGTGSSATSSSVALEGAIGVDVDDSGNVYVVEATNNIVRKIGRDGILRVFAGRGPSFPGSGGNGGPATAARLNNPNSIRHDHQGNMYIADMGNNQIRKVDTAGIITLFAGDGATGYLGDGSLATEARFARPSDLCFDAYGNMFIADKGTGVPSAPGHRIREIFKIDTMHVAANHSDTICGYAAIRFNVIEPVPHYTSKFVWYLNGRIVGGDSAYYYSDSLRNGDRITCTKYDTANGGFIIAVGDTMNITVRPNVVPRLSINPSIDPICEGAQVTFTAAPVHGGSAPHYDWYVFSVISDTTGGTYTYTPRVGDIVTCILHSNELCASPDTARTQFNVHTVPSTHPDISIVPREGMDTAWADTIAYWGQIVTLFSTSSYGGTAPTYQWYLDNRPLPGATDNSYAQHYYYNSTLYCVMHSNAYCVVPESDTSNYVNISVHGLGVNDITKTKGRYSIFPNPSNGNFTITDAGDKGNPIESIIVKDILGKEVFMYHPTTKGTIQLELPAAIQSGNYILTIISKESTENLHIAVEK